MPKVRGKKQSTIIDMTAMSDVTVLLLTFFILTANFIPKEPVQLYTPASVSEIKIPEANRLMILIDPQGRVYLNLDRPATKVEVLKRVAKDYNITFTDKQIKSFVIQPNIGVDIRVMAKFLDMDMEDQDKALKQYGVPADSTNNQFKRWVMHAVAVNKEITGEEITLAIKSDRTTPYPKVKNVLGALQDLKQNRYNLITSLEGMPAGF
ncbi:MAG: biopolymer transporter ExbD [Bacteroidales bacterium]|nr:biopolymer transporter ExbD [Bacteroidales bacterium]